MKPIFKFTGKEISNELYDICKRLELGEVVELEEIEQTEEFILGNNMCPRGIETIYISGREELQQNIINIMSNRGSILIDYNKERYDGEVKNEKKLDIVVGLPASGKSTAIANILSQEEKAVLLDNDEVKKYIPDYFNGWGTGLVHLESRMINEKLFDKALDEGKNIILPKIGGFERQLLNIIEKAKNKDYTVNIHYVKLHRNKALLRLLNRFIEDGRFIPPSSIYQDDNEKEGNKIEKVFESLIKNKKVDGYSMWDNDVAKESPPKLIKYSNIKDELILKLQSNRQQNELVKLNYIEKNFDERYGVGKSILFKRLEYYASQYKVIKTNEFNPEDSIERLNLILQIKKSGILIKNISSLETKQLKKIIENNNLDVEPLTDKINKYKICKHDQLKKTTILLKEEI